MVLNLPGSLFEQRDVRETPKNDPAASTTLGFITISNEADLTADRVLTAGAGISVTDGGANTTATVANTGVTSNVAGEGIDVSGATGAVTISGENATTANKGIASFNTNDFTVAAGAVSLKNKTSYWSCVGADFVLKDHTQGYSVETAKASMIWSGDKRPKKTVNLPNGAVVTGAIVYGEDAGGDASTPAWRLIRYTLADETVSTMATDTWNAEDATISNATIDNSTYGYYLEVQSLDDNNHIYGAKITYTTDYI